MAGLRDFKICRFVKNAMANNDNSSSEDGTIKAELLEMKSMFKIMMERMDSLSAEVHALKVSKSSLEETSHSIPIPKDAASISLDPTIKLSTIGQQSAQSSENKANSNKRGSWHGTSDEESSDKEFIENNFAKDAIREMLTISFWKLRRSMFKPLNMVK